MSAAAPTAPVRAEPPAALAVYRDDGPLALALGRAAAAVPLPPVALQAAGLIALFVLMGLWGADAPLGVTGAAVAALVLTGGLAAGRPHSDRLRWMAPPLLRLVEYAGIVWLAATAGAVPAAFALLCAVAFRHYDLVYRLRHRAVAPPAWTAAATLGWEGRLIATWILLAAGALPTGLYVVASLLAAVVVTEAVHGWRQWLGRAQRPVLYEDDEEEQVE